MPINYTEGKTVLTELPEGIWNAPTTPAPIKLRPSDPPSLSSILEDIDQTGVKLEAELAEYERTKNGDKEVDARRAELIALVIKWEPRVKAAREELTAIDAKPSPFARLVASVSHAEHATSMLGHATLASLYQKTAKDTQDQDYRYLSDGAKRDIRNRESFRGLSSISNTSFCRFGKSKEQNLGFAFETVKRIQDSLIKLGETISKTLNK